MNSTKSQGKKYIVAEISKNWTTEDKPEDVVRDFLACKFEQVISHNLERGYKLYSFDLSQVFWKRDGVSGINETIIAVFERMDHVGSNQHNSFEVAATIPSVRG